MQATRALPIPGFTGYFATETGQIIGRRGLTLRPHEIAGGYVRTNVLTDDGTRSHKLVHVLVAAAFLGPRPPGHQVNHVDGDKTNNRPDNLEYVTPSQNVRHSLDVLGVERASGEDNASATLTTAQVVEMRRRYQDGEDAASVGRAFGVDATHAWRICTYRSWRHIAPVESVRWGLSWRADPVAAAIADRHYNRQSIGAAQFVPPGRCLVLTIPEAPALWVTSWPFAEYVKHAWPGAWVCSAFRNEGTDLSSELIREAVAVTRWRWPRTPSLGMVTFVDPGKIRPKRDPGRCFIRAGFTVVGSTAGGLVALQLTPDAMPRAAEPCSGQLVLA